MRKQGNGDGTRITRHANGKWWQRVTLPDGTRKAFYGETQRDVREKRVRYLADFQSGRITAGSNQKLSAYLAGWLKARRDSLSERSAESYDLNIRRIAPHLGHLMIGELKPAHIRESYTRLLERGISGKALSKRSVQQAHTVLHTALEQAVKEELILRNPCDAVSAPRPERTEMRILTIEQVQQLGAHTENDRLHALWLLLPLTGMRVGEAVALKWGDIDFDGGTVTIQRTLRRIAGRGLQFGPVKTHRSNRRIDLPVLVVRALRVHRDRQRMEQRDWPAVGEDLIITNTQGGRLDSGNVRESLGRRLQVANLPAVRVHDLRHTAASIHLRGPASQSRSGTAGTQYV